MSFLKKIKSALGIGNDQEVDDPIVEIENLPVAPPHIESDAPIEVSEEMMMKIFDKVVEVTNASLPGYLSTSVNADKQKKYLYDALDQSVKQYLIELDNKAQAKCIALWQSERDELNRQMETLKQRAADLETKRNEVNEQKLSSENQRRALNERVRVLDETVMKLEAEKEQLEIENRGLINKAKVAQIYESDMDSMRQELELLRSSVSPEAASAEVEKLQAEIGRHQSEIKQLGNEIMQLQNKNNDLKESCEAAKVKSDMSDAMIKELQKRTSELVQTVKSSEQTISRLNDEIGIMEAQIADLNQKIEEKDARLAEDEDMFEEFAALSDQMNLFEDVKKRLQEKIAQLKEDLKKANDENENLRSTIETNQNEHAREQQAMQQTIEQLRNKNQTPLSSEDLAIDTDAM